MTDHFQPTITTTLIPANDAYSVPAHVGTYALSGLRALDGDLLLLRDY
jgi:hypothetical protein